MGANDAAYRRFGVVADGGKLTAQYNDGSGTVYPADLLASLPVNTWYVLCIVVDDSGRGFYVEPRSGDRRTGIAVGRLG